MGRHGCMIYGGLMLTIIQTHPLNNLIMDTQLSVDLGWYFLLGVLLSYIVVLIYASLLVYSLYLMISAILGSKLSPGDV